jgi:NAD(P)-dependent dehydrogenase (short-subunit alcohol dehydrogenase family)
MSAGRVSGKIAIVTGAASGIGAACARLLARAGAKVVLTDINAEGCALEREAIVSEGGDAIVIPLDTTNEDDWAAAIAALMERYGRLDVAVNCAGVGSSRTFPAEMTYESWRSLMAVNLDGVFLGTKHALAAMTASTPVAGSIINVSSVMGIVALPDVAAYNASKGGVRLLTKSVALSCAEKGLAIRVNSVHPGFIDTPLVRRSMARFSDPEEAKQYYDKLQPVGRLGTPDDVAWGVLYLASDESTFVTGSELIIDGGYTAR